MICFAWRGFPQYAARCVGSFVESVSEEVIVVATKPRVPILGMEQCCKCKVVWIDYEEDAHIDQLLGATPRVIFITGWATKSFNRFGEDVRKSGGKVFQMVDNNYIPGVIEIIKSMRFRAVLRKRFDGYMVPGKSGLKLMQIYGVSIKQVRTGLYSADSKMFNNGDDLMLREKKIIYVGQFSKRKNVVRMCNAFLASKIANKGWVLELFGCGEELDKLDEISRRQSGISIHGFLQPDELARAYKKARAFILPSIEEHWGLVVHEAALSGCYLMLSNRVGSADDLLGRDNGILFNPFRESSISDAFIRLSLMDETAFGMAQKESLRLASDITVKKFEKGAKELLAYAK